MVAEVPVDVFEAVVPVEDPVTSPESPEPRNAEVNYILEMSDTFE